MAVAVIESKLGYKKKAAQIDEIVQLAQQNSVIGIVSLSGISSKALQGIRSSLRSAKEAQASIKVLKNTLKSIALEKISQTTDKKDITQLIPYINGSCAFVFSNTNPFKLQQFLNKNQVPAPARPGQISPVDVFVPEGLTNLDPGPIISELGAIGLQTRIEKGKIRIVKTSKVLSKDETVTESHAAVLARLGIQPFKVGLKLEVALEKGSILDTDILDVNEEKILSDLKSAYMEALSLAVNPQVAYYTEATIPILLQRAISSAKFLALESGYVSKDTIDVLIARATKEAKILKDLTS
ncbi:MAG: 50S ribosomal protein L10 [Candidatus Heimdallarchaeota archaeon]|nr:50S ribosomal protein L10 [Candidatus Heimdallarchaeota archaeon]